MSLDDQPIFWIDLETTGLDPSTNYILEVAVAKATLANPYNFEHIYHAVLSMKEIHIGINEIDPYVFEMHTKSGLFFESYKSKKTLADVYTDLYTLIYTPTLHKDALKPIIAGSCVDFDRNFLKAFLHDIGNCFSHRPFDVSALKLFCKSKGMPDIPKGEAHRAKDDIEESIKHAKMCDEWLYKHYVTNYNRFSNPYIFEGQGMIAQGTSLTEDLTVSIHTGEAGSVKTWVGETLPDPEQLSEAIYYTKLAPSFGVSFPERITGKETDPSVEIGNNKSPVEIKDVGWGSTTGKEEPSVAIGSDKDPLNVEWKKLDGRGIGKEEPPCKTELTHEDIANVIRVEFRKILEEEYDLEAIARKRRTTEFAK